MKSNRIAGPGAGRERASRAVEVRVDTSQFPGAVRAELLRSLRRREINPKFHYASARQAQQWLALHEAYSPARKDPACLAVYRHAFAAASRMLRARSVEVVGLGCGGGQKDAQLLRCLGKTGRRLRYAPVDVSLPLVLTAQAHARRLLPGLACSPLVCDLARAKGLASALGRPGGPGTGRVITFFGMLPNLNPRQVMPRLVAALRPKDLLLLSANLAPGSGYAAGIRRILPLYDNRLTKEWLMTFLLDLGVERGDGSIRFTIEDSPGNAGLKRLEASFRFGRARRIQVESEPFAFARGDRVRLFFSNRHTPGLIRALARRHGLRMLGEWITPSGEEGVFLLRR